MTNDQIKHMVNRFLMWKLPESFNPDCGIHFDADAAKKINPQNHRYEPVGTNLFSYDQAEIMARHMIEGMDEASAQPGEREAMRKAIAEATISLKAIGEPQPNDPPDALICAVIARSALVRMENALRAPRADIVEGEG